MQDNDRDIRSNSKETELSNDLNEKVAVLMPVYRSSKLIRDALKTLSQQTHKNFSVYISDDTPSNELVEISETMKVVAEFVHLDISYKANQKNLGYPSNLIGLVNWAKEDLIFLLAQDDELSVIAIESCVQAMKEFPAIGAVARPYYWYFNEIDQPVRRIKEFGGLKPELINTKSESQKIIHVLVSASQLTGLMYRKSRLNVDFVDSIFPAHIYPLAGALRDCGVAYLPFNTVAVSIQHSQTRNLSSIYEESPAQAWIDMYNQVFGDHEFTQISNFGIQNHMGQNYVGFIQIRCYGSYFQFLREVILTLKIRPLNLVSPKFWLSVIPLSILPRILLRRIVDLFKTRVLARRLRNVRLATIQDKWW
jgi:glycosyltransferase involved in cell wall biosynthesis